jgi:MFS transporter, ACS family, glucarate transporter
MRAPNSRFRVRWLIFSYLFIFAFVAYVQRLSVTIAAERMMPELGLSQLQIGVLLMAFTIGYTIFQFPGGIVGQRFGGRRTLLAIGMIAFIATVATAVIPAFLTGAGLMGGLLVARFVLGLAQAPVFPVSSGVIERWFPAAEWALPQGLQVTGLGLGAAATQPLIAGLMSAYGWQKAIVFTALPVLIVLVLWWHMGRDTPEELARVSAAELAELGGNDGTPVGSHVSWARIKTLLTNRSVLLLTLSYGCMNYLFYLLSFWCFLYLVQERHFTVLESGWLAAIPSLSSAIAAGFGGKWTDALCAKLGPRWGFRLIPVVALPVAGAMLYFALKAHSPYTAVIALSISFASVEMTEAPYWAATMTVARSDTMAATGILNTGANLAGALGTWLVAAMSAHHGWSTAFITGTGLSIASAALWLGVRADLPIPPPEANPTSV